MITCPLCQTSNHHLAITCTSCGSFLQTRVDTLDLFTTSWNLIERPTKAFYTIAVARHKNYMLPLSAIAGIAFTFAFFWIIKAGEYAETFLHLMTAGIVTGPVVGILSVLLYSLILTSIAHLLGIEARLKNAFAITAYALVPVIITVIVLLPIEVMTFGPYFFTRNPSPYQLKPLSYILLIGLDGLFSLWTVSLCVVGAKVLLGTHWLRAGLIVLISLAILGVCFWVVMKLFLIGLW
jgi:hypothetical protein